LERTASKVLLSVQDNGPGVPREQQLALAARGIQGEAGQLLGQGAGLGLALVAQYARLMNARMTLRSGAGGRGWVCEIAFPAFSPPSV
jgi:two-component system sensor histidine kinase TctE